MRFDSLVITLVDPFAQLSWSQLFLFLKWVLYRETLTFCLHVNSLLQMTIDHLFCS